MSAALLVQLDFAHFINAFLGGRRPLVPQSRFQISMPGVGHYCARVDSVAKPGCDVSSAEFMEFELIATALALYASDAIRTPATFNSCPSRQPLYHLQSRHQI